MSGQRHGSDGPVGSGTRPDRSHLPSPPSDWRDSHRVAVPLAVALTVILALLVASQVTGGS